MNRSISMGDHNLGPFNHLKRGEEKKSDIKTPQTHPNHPVVGHNFGGTNNTTLKTAIYYCDSYDPAQGFWMTNISDPSDRKNVSERAIGRTYHKAEDRGDHWFITQWCVCIAKIDLRAPKCELKSEDDKRAQ